MKTTVNQLNSNPTTPKVAGIIWLNNSEKAICSDCLQLKPIVQGYYSKVTNRYLSKLCSDCQAQVA